MTSVVTLFGMQEYTDDPPPTLTVDWLLPEQRIGVEIEVEQDACHTLRPDRLVQWSVTNDGSLRRGHEFILTRPLKGDSLSAAVEEFFRHNRVGRSPTSGTHIHVDMRQAECTLDVVKTMARIVSIIEPAIFGMFTDGREWCGYTNPLSTIPAGASHTVFSDDAPDSDFALVFNPGTREYKYYGFNMLPLGRYGSVEFRYFDTATSADELIEWIQFCMAVKKAALEINRPTELKYYLSTDVCWDEFLTRFFPQWRDRMFALLPYEEVRLNWKRVRSRSSKNRDVPATPDDALATTNKFVNTRFKKFFGTRVLDQHTNTQRVVYDLAGRRAAVRNRLYVRGDYIINSSNFEGKDGDFFVTEDILYSYDAARFRWVERMMFNTSNNRVVDVWRPLSSGDVAHLTHLASERSSNIIGEHMQRTDEVSPSHTLNKLNRIMSTIALHVEQSANIS